jgi:hypothetical protein
MATDVRPTRRRVEDLKNKTLGEILDMILGHRREYPTHGTNCACMDFYAWVIRAQMRDVINKPNHEQSDEERKALWSLNHVLQMITRNL